VYKLCRHVRTSGNRCRSAALPSQHFCHYHATQRQALPEKAPLQFPPLEDRFAIQVAIGRILAALASGAIDRKDAGLYLYGVQIASSNLPRETGVISPLDPVRRVVLTRQNQQVAEAETVLEERDTRGHKKDCQCSTCYSSETDEPHHPDCRCGECHYFAAEEASMMQAETKAEDELAEEDEANELSEPGSLTIHAVADLVIKRKDCHPERTSYLRVVIPSEARSAQPRNPHRRVRCPPRASKARFSYRSARKWVPHPSCREGWESTSFTGNQYSSLFALSAHA